MAKDQTNEFEEEDDGSSGWEPGGKFNTTFQGDAWKQAFQFSNNEDEVSEDELAEARRDILGLIVSIGAESQPDADGNPSPEAKQKMESLRQMLSNQEALKDYVRQTRGQNDSNNDEAKS